MSTNRVTGNSSDGIVILRVARDKEWDKVQIAERFEVPYAQPKTPQEQMLYQAMVEGTLKAVVKHAVERYEKLRHWRWDSSMPVTLDLSDAQYDLEKFRSSRDIEFQPQTQGSIIGELGRIAYVAKMWFIMPKIEVEVVEQEATDPAAQDGFVNPHYMPNYVNLEDK